MGFRLFCLSLFAIVAAVPSHADDDTLEVQMVDAFADGCLDQSYDFITSDLRPILLRSEQMPVEQAMKIAGDDAIFGAAWWFHWDAVRFYGATEVSLNRDETAFVGRCSISLSHPVDPSQLLQSFEQQFAASDTLSDEIIDGTRVVTKAYFLDDVYFHVELLADTRPDGSVSMLTSSRVVAVSP